MTISSPDGTRSVTLERKTIAIDFDCLHPREMWIEGQPTGEPIEGALETLEALRKGYDVVIVTCRNMEKVGDWLFSVMPDAGFVIQSKGNPKPRPQDIEITSRMVPCVRYISPRATRFEGWSKRFVEKVGEEPIHPVP